MFKRMMIAVYMMIFVTGSMGATQELQFVLSPSVITNTAPQGGYLMTENVELGITNASVDIDYVAQSSSAWIDPQPDSGLCRTSFAAFITVMFESADLRPGIHEGKVTFYSPSNTLNSTSLVVRSEITPVAIYGRAYPSMVTQTVTYGCTDTPTITFDVWNDGALTGTWDYVVNPSAYDFGLVAVSPTNGVSNGNHNQHRLMFTNLQSVTPGTYYGSVYFQDSGYSNSAYASVQLNVLPAPPQANMSTNVVNVTVNQGHNPADQMVSIINTGGSPLSWYAKSYEDWITVTPSTNDCPAGLTNAFTLSFQTDRRDAGQVQGLVRLFNMANGSHALTNLFVNLTVNAQDAAIDIYPRSMDVTTLAGNASTTQSVYVINRGLGDMSYTVTVDTAGCSITPTSGVASAGMYQMHSLVVDASLLGEQVYTGRVTVVSASAGNSPLYAPVQVQAGANIAMQPHYAQAVFTAQQSMAVTPVTLTLTNRGSANAVDVDLLSTANWMIPAVSQTQVTHEAAVPLQFVVTNLEAGVRQGRVVMQPQPAGSPSGKCQLFLLGSDEYGAFHEKILYYAVEDGYAAIRSINPDGSDAKIVLSKPGCDLTQPRISPDGFKLAYTQVSNSVSELRVRDLRTGDETVCRALSSINWLGNSTDLVGIWLSKPYILTYTNNTMRRIYVDSGRVNLGSVDPVTDTLLYTRDPNDLNNTRLHTLTLGTNNTRTEVASANGRRDYLGQWSKNGSLVAYSEQTRGGTAYNLYIHSSTGGSPAQVTSHSNEYSYFPAFSMDDGSLVYLHLTTNTTSLHVLSLSDHSDVEIYAFAEITMTQPQWCWMYELYPVNPLLDIQSLSLQTNTVEACEKPVTLSFTIRNGGNSILEYAVSNGVSWCSLENGANSSTGQSETVQVSLSALDLEPGIFTNRLIVTANATNSPQTVEVVLTVEPKAPVFALAPTSMVFEISVGGSKTGQYASVWNEASIAPMPFVVQDNADWLTVYPTSGTSTGDVVDCYVECAPDGLSAGNYTGTVDFVYEQQTQQVAVGMTILPAPPVNTPVLEVEPLALTGQVVRTGSADSMSLRVRNAGFGVMVYRVAETSDVMRVYPNLYAPRAGMSAGEWDTLRVEYDTRFMAEGSYTSIIHLVTSTETQDVPVVMHILPRPRVTLTLHADPVGSGAFITDPQMDKTKTFEQGTYVRVIALADDDHTFDYWSTNRKYNTHYTDVYMQSNVDLTAHFEHKTKLCGRMYNEITGRAVDGGLFIYADGRGMVATSGVDGVWALDQELSCNELPWIAIRDGYVLEAGRYEPVCQASNNLPIPMTPRFVTNVRAEQVPGTELVSVTYDLTGSADDDLNVSLQLSADNGGRWTIFPLATLGCVGPVRSPRRNMMVLWNAGSEWDQLITTTMVARVNAGGGSAVSPAFRVDTLQCPNWTLYVTARREEGGSTRVAGAEVYYGGRTTNSFVGLTDANGEIEIAAPARAGQAVFVRKQIYTQAARFTNDHASVDDTMFQLWLDSDLGPDPDDDAAWDGTWRTYTLTDADMTQISLGSRMTLPLEHPLFEWNMLVSLEPGSTNFAYSLNVGFERASCYMYDIYDGQMKFGVIAMSSGVSRVSTLWSNSDMRVWNVTEAQALTRIDPFNFRTNPVPNRPWARSEWIEMGTTWWHAHPWQADYFRSIVHECGHYHQGLGDEYLNGNERRWRTWRESHTNDFTKNYGLMDNEHSISELSSQNDYPVLSRPINPTNSTAQSWYHELGQTDGNGIVYSCWDWVQDNYNTTSWSGYVVRVIGPPDGAYINGFSTSQDRYGPHEIPSPYSDVIVRSYSGTDVWIDNPYLRSVPSQSPLNQEPVTVYVKHNGKTVAGAQIAQFNSKTHTFGIVGKTDSDGTHELIDAFAESQITAAWQGRSVTRSLTQYDIRRGTLELVLQADVRDSYVVGSNRLALIMGGALAANGQFVMQIQSSQILSDGPQVILWRDNMSSNNIAFTQSGAQADTFTAAMDMSSSLTGTLSVEVNATNGSVLSSQDGYHMALGSNLGFLDSYDGHVEIYFSGEGTPDQAPALCYQYNGPSMINGLDRTVQVGPQIYFTRPDAATYFSQHYASMNWGYRDEDIGTADESSIRLYHWATNQQQWVSVDDVIYDPSDNSVSAGITNDGTFALFGVDRTDTTPPATITNLLAVSGTRPGYVDLAWTAPGDDGMSGTALAYYVQSGTNAVDAETWDSVYTPLSMTPKKAGETETYSIRESIPGDNYFYTIRAVDAAGNYSQTSNVSAATALLDDSNGDGISDSWLASMNIGRSAPMGYDDDADNDGLTTWEEYQAGTDANAWDTDGDQMSDAYEEANGLNPLSAQDAGGDLDNDLLSNVDESRMNTYADQSDSDGDLYLDGLEVSLGTDPLSADSSPGTLTVNLDPSAAQDAGAAWCLNTGESCTNWQSSGTTATLGTGVYTVIYKAIDQWTTPANLSLTIDSGATSTVTGMYLRVRSPSTGLPWLMLLTE
ncbi:MAG: hypothetical protein EOL87_03870 [Spartobacteria bacterium]|nr:hypothetical protein [Spartobacteria bacterium]